jgi:hypothetical protein
VNGTGSGSCLGVNDFLLSGSDAREFVRLHGNIIGLFCCLDLLYLVQSI